MINPANASKVGQRHKYLIACSILNRGVTAFTKRKTINTASIFKKKYPGFLAPPKNKFVKSDMTINMLKACCMVANAKNLPPYSAIGPDEISCGACIISKGRKPNKAGRIKT